MNAGIVNFNMSGPNKVRTYTHIISLYADNFASNTITSQSTRAAAPFCDVGSYDV